MSQPLPLQPNLEWLKKCAKDRLAELRAGDPLAKLSQAQLALAREYGFPSWRKLKAHVEQLRETAPHEQAQPSVSQEVPPDGAELAQLLSAVHAGDLQI